MKQILLLMLICPLLSAAQNKPWFENDTLHTSCGYKIYKGQTLQFGKAKSFQGFKYISIMNGVPVRSLEDNSIVVKELSNYTTSAWGYPIIQVTGSIVFRDGSKGAVSLSMAFDQAIGSRLPGTYSELIVPEEFRITKENAAGYNMPSFEGDTLFTSCGYKIYKGQVLQFGIATGNRDKFRYVNIKNRVPHMMLQKQKVKVKELKDFGISALGNGYITIIGTLMVNNNERGEIEMHVAFDHAIENIPGVPSELVVPDEFRNRIKTDPQEEVKRLEDLYRNGTISREELEMYKKKLLQQ